MENLKYYNTDTLHELYAHAFWKVYKRFPKATLGKTKRNYLIHKIKKLEYKAETQGD